MGKKIPLELEEYRVVKELMKIYGYKFKPISSHGGMEHSSGYFFLPGYPKRGEHFAFLSKNALEFVNEDKPLDEGGTYGDHHAKMESILMRSRYALDMENADK